MIEILLIIMTIWMVLATYLICRLLKHVSCIYSQLVPINNGEKWGDRE